MIKLIKKIKQKVSSVFNGFLYYTLYWGLNDFIEKVSKMWKILKLECVKKCFTIILIISLIFSIVIIRQDKSKINDLEQELQNSNKMVHSLLALSDMKAL